MLTVLALAAAIASPASGELAILADELAAAVDGRFLPVEGRIVEVTAERVVVQLGPKSRGLTVDRLDIEPVVGQELVWLVDERPLLEPVSLEPLGWLRRVCGHLTIERVQSDGIALAVATAAPGCDPPVVGAPVQSAQPHRRLRMEGGSAAPSVRGVRDLLLQVLPDRLRRTGRFEPVAGNAEATDIQVRLSASLLGRRLQVLAEIIATDRSVQDLVHIETPLAPEFLWRDHDAQRAPVAIASLSVRGEILALAAAARDAALVVLTSKDLLLVRLTEQEIAEVRTLQELSDLPGVDLRPRIGSGTLSRRAATDICFGSNLLRHGYCLRDDGTLEQTAGVPMLTPAGLAFSSYRVGTNVLTGVLHLPNRDVDLGPLLGIVRISADRSLVRRETGNDDEIDADLRYRPGGGESLGDAMVVLSDGTRVASSTSIGLDRDEILLQAPGGMLHSRFMNGPITALGAADLDGDGRDEVAVATGIGDQSLITILRR